MSQRSFKSSIYVSKKDDVLIKSAPFEFSTASIKRIPISIALVRRASSLPLSRVYALASYLGTQTLRYWMKPSSSFVSFILERHIFVALASAFESS